MGLHVGNPRAGRWPLIYETQHRHEVLDWYDDEDVAKSEQDRIRRLSDEDILAIKYGEQIPFTEE